MDSPLCDECTVGKEGDWFDDDGVIRCHECHANWATAQGGDYDYLVAQREKNGIRAVLWEDPGDKPK